MCRVRGVVIAPVAANGERGVGLGVGVVTGVGVGVTATTMVSAPLLLQPEIACYMTNCPTGETSDLFSTTFGTQPHARRGRFSSPPLATCLQSLFHDFDLARLEILGGGDPTYGGVTPRRYPRSLIPIRKSPGSVSPKMRPKRRV